MIPVNTRWASFSTRTGAKVIRSCSMRPLMVENLTVWTSPPRIAQTKEPALTNTRYDGCYRSCFQSDHALHAPQIDCPASRFVGLALKRGNQSQRASVHA